jgi:hypothetical protein
MVEIGRKRELGSRTPKADLKVGHNIKRRRDIVAPFLFGKRAELRVFAMKTAFFGSDKSYLASET